MRAQRRRSSPACRSLELSLHGQERVCGNGSEQAREAGRKGGEVVSKNHEHMATIGRLGGLARGRHEQIAVIRVRVSDGNACPFR